jgi:hypothetical protein
MRPRRSSFSSGHEARQRPPHATSGPAVAPRHGRGRPGLVDEHESLWLQVRLPRAPGAARGGDIGAVLLGGVLTLFLREPRGDEEPAERGAARPDLRGGQPVAQLGDRQIRLGRRERVDPLGVGGHGRALRAADPFGLERAPLMPTLHQLDHEADAHLELGRGRPP